MLILYQADRTARKLPQFGLTPHIDLGTETIYEQLFPLGNRCGSRRSIQSRYLSPQAFPLAEPLEPRQLLSANLLVNPSFAAGNTGFSSQYRVGTQPGEYEIAKGPQSVYSGVVPFGPHSGSGLQLLANGSTSGTAYVYDEAVSVAKNTTYDFSGFATTFAQTGNDHTDPSPAPFPFMWTGRG